MHREDGSDDDRGGESGDLGQGPYGEHSPVSRHGQHPRHTRYWHHGLHPGAEQGEFAEPPGVLVTNVRRYNAVVAVLFAGRRGSLNATLAAASGAQPGDEVLDVGCGPGRLAHALARRVGPAGQVTGVDPARQMVDYAQRRAGLLPNCRFLLSSAQQLDVPDASVDVVTSTFVLHHIPPEARAEAFAQMYRVLRPGGRLLLADAYPTGPVAAALARLVGRRGGHGHGHEHGHGRGFADTDVREYAGALREVGFHKLYFRDFRPWTRCLRGVRPE